MNNLPKLSKKKKFSLYIAKSQEVSLTQGKLESPLMKKRKTLSKKPLSMPLTDLLVGPEETYDISQDFEVQEILGVGTYSSVKSAIRLSDRKSVAIKTSSGATSVGFLRKEKDILESLDSDFFPQIYDFKVDKIWNKAYLIMENIQGVTLKEYIQENEVVTSEILRSFVSQMWAMVKYLHQQGVCHRDIKPENVIVTKEGNLKLLDFNISSRNISKKFTEDQDTDVFYTQISTPKYAAPELSSGAGYTQAIDLWGIGIIGYLLWGMRIEDEKSTVESDGKEHLQKSLQTLSSIPQDLRKFLWECLSVDPALRPTPEHEFFSWDGVTSFLGEKRSHEIFEIPEELSKLLDQ